MANNPQLDPAHAFGAGDPVTIDDIYKVIDANRGRIRSLATLLGTTASLMVTISTAILAYIFKRDAVLSTDFPLWIRYLYIAGIFFSVLTFGFACFAIYVLPPQASATRAALMSTLAATYERERMWIKVASVAILIAVALVVVATGFFAFDSSPKPAS
jgi:signal transduction histidine kinase